jgi:hypothetical protein
MAPADIVSDIDIPARNSTALEGGPHRKISTACLRKIA